MERVAATNSSGAVASWRNELTLGAIVPSLAIAIMQTGAAISLAVLVFADAAVSHLAVGATTFLIGSALASSVLAWRSSFNVVVAGARNNVTVVIAAVAAGAAAQATDQPGPTVAAFVMVAALTSGVLLYVTGRFRLGHLVRFVPFPVMGGYVAGTAWLMVKGGAQVMTDTKLGFNNLGDLATWPLAQLLLPGVALALLIVFLPGANRQSLAILASLVGFHALIRVVSSPPDIEANGWVVGPLPSDAGINLFTPTDLRLAEWGAITEQAAGLGAIALIALTAALLNVSGVEFASGEEVDIDHELRASGFATALSGAAGGTVGFVALGPTVLARQLEASSRLVTAAFVSLATITVVVGPSLVGWMPRFVAGAMIMGPGIALLRGWLTNSMRSGPTSDRVIALLIPLTIGFVGVLEGVGLGIIVAAGLFIMRYASIDPVRTASTGFAMRSTVDRNRSDTTTLDRNGHRIVVLRLEGFLFFGTAARLSERISSMLAESQMIEHVVVDLRRVSGVDSSARNELTKLVRRCQDNNATLYLAAMPDDLLESFEGQPIVELAIADLDRALAQAEAAVLVRHGATQPTVAEIALSDASLRYFQRMQVAIGTTLLATGHASSAMYLVEAGTFTVWSEGRSGSQRLRQVGRGAFLGDVGLFTGSNALATVTADIDCVVLRLDRSAFDEMARRSPDAALEVTAQVLAKTSERLAITNALIRDLNQ